MMQLTHALDPEMHMAYYLILSLCNGNMIAYNENTRRIYLHLFEAYYEVTKIVICFSRFSQLHLKTCDMFYGTKEVQIEIIKLYFSQ